MRRSCYQQSCEPGCGWLATLSTPLGKPLLRRFFTATFTDSDPVEWRVEVLDRLDAVPAEAAKVVVHGALPYDSDAALRALSVQAFGGTGQGTIPIRLDRLPAQIKRAEVAGVGHWPHVHAAAEVNAIVDGFLADR
jgi:hypothetical protein